MANVKQAMQSKSDQLNYVDVGNGSLIALIESVHVTNSDQQPITINFAGCNGKPYKPNKGKRSSAKMIPVMRTNALVSHDKDRF